MCERQTERKGERVLSGRLRSENKRGECVNELRERKREKERARVCVCRVTERENKLEND